MKKILILLLAISLSEARSTWNRDVEDRLPRIQFSSSKIHEFRYSTHLVSGIPRSSSLHSGLKLETDVEMYPEYPNSDRQEIKMKLKNPKLLTILENLQDQDPSERISSSRFQELENSDRETEFLKKPFKIEISSEGEVKKISFDEKDPIWSRNVKRGLTSHFQMNLRPSSQDLPDFIKKDDLPESLDKELTFTVYENGISGDCETTYTIRADRSLCTKRGERDEECPKLSNNLDKIEVRKVRNHEKCRSRPEHRASFLFSVRSSWEKKEKKPYISSTTSIKMILKKTENSNEGKYRIEETSTTGKHVFSLYDEVKGGQETTVRSDLSFNQMGSSSKPSWVDSSNYQSSISSTDEHYDGPLQLEIPEDHLLNREIQGSQPTDQKRMELIKKLFQDVVQSEERDFTSSSSSENMKETDGEKSLMKKVDLLNLMRQCSKKELDQLDSQIVSSSQGSSSDRLKNNIWYTMLSACGTPQSVNLLIEKMEQDYDSRSDSQKKLPISDWETKFHVLRKIPKPTDKMTDKLSDFCKKISDNSDDSHKTLESRCWFTFGSLIEGVCDKITYQTDLITKKEKEHQKRRCSKSTIDKYSEIYENYLRRFKSDSERRRMVLHSVLNSQVMVGRMLKEITEIIEDKTLDASLRETAVACIGKASMMFPEISTRLMTPVFKDRSEEPVIRAMAFSNLISASAAPHYNVSESQSRTIELLVSDLKDEPSEVTKAFVYNTVKQLAKSAKGFCGDAFRNVMKKVYNTIRKVKVDKSLISGIYRFSKMFHEHNVGLASDIFVVPGYENPVPRILFSGSAVQMKDIIVPTGIFGFSVDGLNKVINKLAEKPLLEKILPHTYHKDSKHFHWHSELLGNLQTIFSTYMNKDSLYDLIDNPSRLLSALQTLSSGIDVDKYYSTMFTTHNQVPTEVGIPLDVNATVIMSHRIKGEVKGQLVPSRDSSSFWNIIPRNLELTVDVNHRGNFYVHVMMSPRLPFVTPGSKVLVKTSHRLPGNFKTLIDIQKKTATVTLNNVNQKIKVGSFKVEPQVCIVKRTSNWRYESKPIRGEEKCNVRTIDKTFPKTSFLKSPIVMNVRGVMPSGKSSEMASFPYDAFRNYAIYYNGEQLRDRDLKITLKYETSTESNQDLSSMRYPNLWDTTSSGDQFSFSSSLWSSSSSSSRNNLETKMNFPNTVYYKTISSSSSFSPKTDRLMIQIKPKSSPESEALTCKLDFHHDLRSKKGILDFQMINPESNYQQMDKFHACERYEYDGSQDKDMPKIGAKWAWGQTCTDDKSIDFNLNVEKKSSMRDEVREIKERENCQDESRSSSSQQKCCRPLDEMMHSDKRMTGNLSWRNLPETLKNKMRNVWSVVKSLLILKSPLRVEQISESNPSDKITFDIDMRHYLHDDKIRLPHETLKLQGYPLPRSMYSWLSTHYKQLMRPSYTCRVSKDGEISTVDRTLMKFSLNNYECENVISADCEDKTYVVTSDKRDSSGNKKVRIHLNMDRQSNQQTVIELSRESQEQRVRIHTKEGSNSKVERSLPYDVMDPTDNSKRICRCYYGSNEKVVVDCRSVKIQTDCRDIHVETKIHERNICGLCNNYGMEDGKQWGELKHYEEPHQMVASLPSLVSTQCRKDDVKKSRERSGETTPSSCNLIQTSDMIMHGQKLCFPTQPLMRCPSGCARDVPSNQNTSDKVQVKSVDYKCFDKSHSRMSEFQRKIENKQYVDVTTESSDDVISFSNVDHHQDNCKRI